MTITRSSGVDRDLWSREFRAKIESEERQRRLMRRLALGGGLTGFLLLALGAVTVIWWLIEGRS